MISTYQFKQLQTLPGVIHGFSRRQHGNMRKNNASNTDPIVSIATSLHIAPGRIVRMQQVHGGEVKWVELQDIGSEISGVDALLTAEKKVFVSVVSADCVPLLLYDRLRQYAGVVHAGWRGLYDEIIPYTISEMKREGSNPADILVGIGPCIRSCCYDIDEKRVSLFKEKFEPSYGKPLGFLVARDHKWFLNMPYLSRFQLMQEGVLDSHIEDSGICTYDNPTEFYSFRREGKKFGEFIGLIGTV